MTASIPTPFLVTLRGWFIHHHTPNQVIRFSGAKQKIRFSIAFLSIASEFLKGHNIALSVPQLKLKENECYGLRKEGYEGNTAICQSHWGPLLFVLLC
jgi:hypothetical protein